MDKTIHNQEFHELAMDYRGANTLNANTAYVKLVEYIDQYVENVVSAATKPTADLSTLTVYEFSAFDNGDHQQYVKLADVQSLLATKPAAAPERMTP